MPRTFIAWLQSQDLSQFDRATPASYHEHDFIYDARDDADMPDIYSASELCSYLLGLPTVLDGAYVGAMLAWLRYANQAPE